MGTCDCHAHVFGPAARFPYSTPRSYTPPDSPLAEYLAMHDTLTGLPNRVMLAERLDSDWQQASPSFPASVLGL